MSQNITEAMLISHLRVQRIIIACLMIGVGVFLGYAIFISQGRAPIQGLPMLSFVAVIVAVATLTAREVAPRLQVKLQRQKIADGTWQFPPNQYRGTSPPPANDADKLLIVYQMQLIVRAGLVEAPTFLCGLAYMNECQPWILGLAFFLLALQALNFPTRDRVERWVRDQLELIELERSRSN